ncbi:MAG: S9 family peptidase [Krumholzibacteria bacterium]|nr:S9 family peptidase [Candidatus Krumholzibacteria bacterium]
MKRPAFRFLLAVTAGLLLAAAGARAMVPGDILELRRARTADLSPDGRWLLYTISAWDDVAGRWRPTLYRRDLDQGGDLLVFTPEDQARDPVFRPDARAVAYLRDTEAGTEVWLMDPDGADRRHVAGPGTFGALHWSPGGDALAWIATTAVGAYPGEPGVRWVDDELGYRRLGEGERGGDLAQLFVMDLFDRRPRRLGDAPLDVRSCAWSPDGSRLVFAAKARTDLGRTLNEDLWVVDRGGGEPRRLTANPGPDAAPAWLADGTIAYTRGEDPLGESSPKTIAVLDPEVGDAALLAQYGYDNMFWRWAAGDGAFYVLGARRGTIDLVRVGPGEPSFLTEAEGNFSSVRLAAGRAVLDGTGQTLPGGIFLVDLRGRGKGPREARLLIDPNAEWRQRVGLVEPEPFFVEVDGARIEGWFFRPPDAAPLQRVPVVLSLHGGPEWMYGGSFLPEFHILPRHGYGVIAANPVGSTGYGFPFQAAIRGDWTDRPAREVLACVDLAVARGWGDPDRIAVMGGSYGGHLGAALTAQSDRFRAAALDRMYPEPATFWGTTDEKWFPEWEFHGRPFDPEAREVYRRNSPWEQVDRVTTPTLVSHGLRDWRCPVQGGEMWFAALRSRGVPARLIRFVDEGHGIRGPRNLVFYHDQVLAWFDTHVLGPSLEGEPSHE